MRKTLVVLAVLVGAASLLGLVAEKVDRAYASSVAPTETVAAVSLPSDGAVVQSLREAIAADGTEALPGQVEPVLVGSPQPTAPARHKPIEGR